jgi:hypothetical protein
MKRVLFATFLLVTPIAAHPQDANPPAQRVRQADRIRIFTMSKAGTRWTWLMQTPTARLINWRTR